MTKSSKPTRELTAHERAVLFGKVAGTPVTTEADIDREARKGTEK